MMWSGSLADHSGSVTTGGTSQEVMPARHRKYLFVQNPADASETLFVNFGTAASTTAKNSLELEPGGSITMELGFVCTQAVHVTAATTGHTYIAKEGG